MHLSPRTPLLVAILACLAGPAAPARAQVVVPDGFDDQPVVSGLNFPTSFAFLPDGRVVLIEKNDARIRLIVNEHLVSTPVAVIDSVRLDCGGGPCYEAGLLGITVDPGWPVRPYLYTMYDWSGGPYLRLARLTAKGDLTYSRSGHFTAEPDSEFLIFADLQDNTEYHQGGTLRFGPDRMLYFGVGDDLTNCFAPYVPRLVGKILRIDVGRLPPGAGSLQDYELITNFDNPFVYDEDPRARLVWASGLRNPWGFHIDRATDRIFIPDVGENSYEEVSVLDSPGQMFGWPWYEGYARTTATCEPLDSTGSRAPIHVYDRRDFEVGSAIMGAGVYRRPLGSTPLAFPFEYEGDYFFSDIGMGFLRRLHETENGWAIADSVPGQPSATDWGRGYDNVTEYQIGPDGALYYLKNFHITYTNTGQLRRIQFYSGTTSAPSPAPSPFALERPWPSPSRGTVNVGFSLARPAPVRVRVHDLLGRHVRTLIESDGESAGRRSLAWDGRDEAGTPVRAGLYVIALTTPDGTASSRCLIVR